jgi:hypothetical protein
MNYPSAIRTIAALLVLGAACADEELVPEDYACDVVEDCAIRSVPACCDTSSTSTPLCLNEGAAVPDEIDCDDNEGCAATLAISRCECVDNELFEGEGAPAKICNGVP